MNKKLLIALCFVGGLFSCADNDMIGLDGTPDKPARLAAYEYLDSYSPLKTYIDKSKYPNFKLGTGVTVADYNQKALTYRLVNTNFDEIVAGNAMKMASCVNDKGEMDFSKVQAFVQAATDTDVNIYGHTLAWHSQQPVKWLNKLLEDKPLPEDPNGGGNPCLVFDNGEGGANSWDKQGIYTLTKPMEAGKTYVVKAKIKSTEGGDCALWPIWSTSDNKNQWGGSNDVQYLATYGTTTDFTEYAWEFTADFPHDQLQFVFGKLVGKIYFDDLSCMEKGTDVEMVENGSFDEPLKGWAANWNGPSFTIETIVAAKGLPCLVYDNGEGKTNSWDAQAIYTLPVSMEQGKTYIVTVNVKSENGGPLGLWPIWSASPNKNQWGGSNDVQYLETYENIAKKFTEYIWEFSAAFPHDQLQFVFGQLVGKLYFQSVSCVEKETGKELMPNTTFESLSTAGWGSNWQGPSFGMEMLSMASIPLTDEEKKDTLTWAMDRWIKGMMEACEGKVKAWDVVNEAISGGDTDGDGVYDLQHGKEGDTQNFFWQDYLGDLDYVRTAVRLAREYGPEDIKLFVNDYNLEYDWDASGNKKLESLIKWIERWESDGITKIDGIGTQMHISCYADPTEQNKRKELIKKSFELMAKTGKLVRVSELDISYIDADGKEVDAADMTETQLHEMADFYKWLVQQYLELIPANQQWGICFWTCKDDPASSSWRHVQLYGFWDKDYYRTHSYAGVADALSGK
ncbi:MAG: endo-1,4-beta-xylanase [Prevotella sp.]|nr:endo-1,4-beta-xylanase [Prevotella sp.]